MKNIIKKATVTTLLTLGVAGLLAPVAAQAAPATSQATTTATQYCRSEPAFTLVDQQGRTWYFGRKTVCRTFEAKTVVQPTFSVAR
jgi:hypothetical protein